MMARENCFGVEGEVLSKPIPGLPAHVILPTAARKREVSK